MPSLDYEPDGRTLAAFFHASDFVRVLIGPFGSGKTVACSIEVFRRACEQAPGPDKVRRSKWLVVRSTYPQLRSTTIPSWRQWFSDGFGTFNLTPPITHRMVLPLDDGTIADIEVIFMALDGPDAESALKGFEGTGVWFNEAREIPKAVFDFALGRVGRYPATKDGGPSWYGVIADSNPPDFDAWLYKMAEEAKPAGWGFFKQPGGVVKPNGRWTPNPDAENTQHLPPNFYMKQMASQSEDWIRVFLGGEYGFVQEGKPVYPEWLDTTHVANEALAPIEKLPLVIGLDFGLTPAAVFAQRTARGQWRVIDELVTEDMGVVRFSELLSARLDAWYGDVGAVEAWGDPAGNARATTDERTCFEIIRKHTNIPCKAAPTNEPTIRREAVAGALNRLVDGEPGFLLSPACKVLRKGFAGGYHYRRVRVVGDERFHDKPDKNAFSHPHDALQYLLSGAGEGRALLGKEQRRATSRPGRANSRYNPTQWRAS